MKPSIIIGQYLPGQSLLHRLDPRTKLLSVLCFVIVIFFANNWSSYSLLTGLSLLAVWISKIPLTYLLKGMTPVWFFVVFTFFIQLFLRKEGTLLFELGFVTIYENGIRQGTFIALRFFLLFLIASLLTLTTSPMELTDALEDLLAPLKKWKFPVHELSLMMSISLRFIPTLMEETEKISKAQASRGVDFKTGKLKDRIYAIVPLLIPLFISAFKRAEELAMAMEARGYQGGEGRTKLRKLIFTRLDIQFICLYSIALIMFFYIIL
ncbi:energy-coupling factor transporter transmembrane component T [Gracilibacillus sp. YIM 98692]|uniref:energy-coupling factor transporter transmembrane component T family protein n=1 Tax=Gracilibacillus sp. YIM 98692 TaxID=2663532 RepID=UPI0013D5A070|nr:energy-coupling factor transporter transmembrane component T [Gracilibacillus sp. YIM 98692]